MVIWMIVSVVVIDPQVIAIPSEEGVLGVEAGSLASLTGDRLILAVRMLLLTLVSMEPSRSPLNPESSELQEFRNLCC